MILSTRERLTPTLAWEVLQKPLFTNTGEEITTHQQLVNSSTGQQIAVMPKTYKPYFNELFNEKVEEISRNTDLQFLGYHVFKNDSRLIAVFENNETEILGHKHSRYVGLLNSHDGSHTIKMLQNVVMHRCSNGLTVIQTGKSTEFKVAHTKYSHNRMNYEVRKVVQSFDDSLKEYVKQADTMQKQRIHQRVVDFLLNEMKGADDTEKSTRMSNIIDKMQRSYNIESQDLGQNTFAFLHGMTRYANENLQKNSGFASFYGSAAKHNQKAYYLALNAMQLYKNKLQQKLVATS